MKIHALVERLGISTPIIQAPMAGGATTPELVAAVSNAGGLGSLAGGYVAAAKITEAVARTRALTSRPFAVNLLVDTRPEPPKPAEVQDWIARLAPYHAELGLPAPTLPAKVNEPFEEQLEAVLQAHPAMFSFTLGIPSAAVLEDFRRQGILLAGTATSIAEAVALQESGVDAIVAQGSEAGAHRGTFLHDAMTPTADLVEQLAQAVKLPVIASGGIMEGAGIALAISRGAAMAQLGTSFLVCPEAGTSAPYREALLAVPQTQEADVPAGSATIAAEITEMITVFSGRAARGLRNRFTEELRELRPLPYPYQNALTRELRAAAAKLHRKDFLSLWAGTGVTRVRPMDAAELVRTLTRELLA